MKLWPYPSGPLPATDDPVAVIWPIWLVLIPLPQLPKTIVPWIFPPNSHSSPSVIQSQQKTKEKGACHCQWNKFLKFSLDSIQASCISPPFNMDSKKLKKTRTLAMFSKHGSEKQSGQEILAQINQINNKTASYEITGGKKRLNYIQPYW